MSTIVTDTLQGKTSATSITLPTTTNIGSTPLVSASANSMTIRGEGSATTNIQQGLVKVFNSMSHDSGTPTTVDSFNVASMLDSGTGNYRVNYTNNMTHAKDCVLALSNYRSGSAQLKNICLNENTSFQTSHHAIIMGEGSWTLKDGECNNSIAVGDLA